MNINETKYIQDVVLLMNSAYNEKLDVLLKETNIVVTDNKITDVKILIEISEKTYKIVDNKESFNLNGMMRKQDTSYEFLDNKPIEIDLTLNKKLYSTIHKDVKNAKGLISYFENINNNENNSILLNTENWFANYVKQEVDIPDDMEGSLKMGYATRWLDLSKYSDPFVRKIYLFFIMKTLNCEILNSKKIVFKMYVKDDIINFYTNIRKDINQIVLYSSPQLKIPEEKRMETCKKINEINFDLPVGNFELDFEDGEIRFKTYFESVDSSFSNDYLKLLLESNIYTMTKYLDEIKS